MINNHININLQNAIKNIDDRISINAEHIASGRRIDNLKDPLTFATISRLSSNIKKDKQSLKSAVDVTSLVQVAGGSFENCIQILDRASQLAIMAKNNAYSDHQRRIYQNELNELITQFDNIINRTRYNNNSLLNGSMINAEFQIGEELNETIRLSLEDMRSQSLGVHTFNSNNPDGIQQATYSKILGRQFNGPNQNGDNGIGSSIGVSTGNLIAQGTQIAAYNNNYRSEVFTISNINHNNQLREQTATFNDNDTADIIAENLNNLEGVHSNAFNKITLSDFNDSTNETHANIAIAFKGLDFANLQNGMRGFLIDMSHENSAQELARVINNDQQLAQAGIYAKAYNNGEVDVFSFKGHDIVISNSSQMGTNASVRVTSALDGDNNGYVVGSQNVDTRGGRVDVILEQSYEMKSNSDRIFGGVANENLKFTVVGVDHLINSVKGNSVKDQELTIYGYSGNETIRINENEQANSIVNKINAKEGLTNVRATALTRLTLENLSQDGMISFHLKGDNGNPVRISARVTTTDYTDLSRRINDVANLTGIKATLNNARNKVMLTHDTGKNIVISNFNHSEAYDYPFELNQNNNLLVDNNANIDGNHGNVCYMDVRSNALINEDLNNGNDNANGNIVRLYEGGGYHYTNYFNQDYKVSQDSTTVGGQITFISSDTFHVESNINGRGYFGSITSGRPNLSHGSNCTYFNQADISNNINAHETTVMLDAIKEKVVNANNYLSTKMFELENVSQNLENRISKSEEEKDKYEKVDITKELQNLQENITNYKYLIYVMTQINRLPEYLLNILNNS